MDLSNHRRPREDPGLSGSASHCGGLTPSGPGSSASAWGAVPSVVTRISDAPSIKQLDARACS